MISLDIVPLDIILGAAAALFLLGYMIYALLWPEKF